MNLVVSSILVLKEEISGIFFIAYPGIELRWYQRVRQVIWEERMFFRRLISSKLYKHQQLKEFYDESKS